MTYSSTGFLLSRYVLISCSSPLNVVSKKYDSDYLAIIASALALYIASSSMVSFARSRVPT